MTFKEQKLKDSFNKAVVIPNKEANRFDVVKNGVVVQWSPNYSIACMMCDIENGM